MFSKSDLKTGMRVETRDGTRYVVFVERYQLSNGENWLQLKEFDEDLKDNCDSRVFDIVKVFAAPFNPASLINVREVGLLLYERIEPLTMSIAEAQAELSKVKGREVLIIKE